MFEEKNISTDKAEFLLDEITSELNEQQQHNDQQQEQVMKRKNNTNSKAASLEDQQSVRNTQSEERLLRELELIVKATSIAEKKNSTIKRQQRKHVCKLNVRLRKNSYLFQHIEERRAKLNDETTIQETAGSYRTSHHR